MSGFSAAACAGQANEPVPAGKELFQRLCVECHGEAGEGVADAYEEPLYGDLRIEELAEIIDATMPENDPEACTGEEARQVAAYMYDAFYSPEARLRFVPPRVELARLTVRQYENSLADLIGSFRDREEPGDERGLAGQYYKVRNFQRDERAFERIDPQIAFDFGEGSPDAEAIKPEEFSMRWEGSLIVEATGDYEFCLKTPNGARLWVNDTEKPLIDAWVSSGNEVREHIGPIRLLAGRVYPVRLQFFKYKEKSASLELRWRPPYKAWQTIPEEYLSPRESPEVFVTTTPFPPDDGSMGYERGTSVSEAWDAAATNAAFDVAEYVLGHLRELADVRDGAEAREEKLREFCRQFVERAFRRPLTEEETRFFVETQFREAEDVDAAVKRVVLLTLKSPRFLYPEAGARDWQGQLVAARLSLALWDSLPDEALLEAAADGRLDSREAVAREARRMLADPRAKAKLRDFFDDWLGLDEVEDISKSATVYPQFDEQLVSDLRTSLELFIEEVVWSDESDYRDLLLSDYLYLNDRLAAVYGAVDSEAADEFHKVVQGPDKRAGVLTHPYLLAALAYYESTSPIHRGVFLTRKVMGRALKPPPAAIQFMDGSFDPHMTMREKVAELTKSEDCQGCHRIINPLGFSLEHYDAIGRFRTEDKGRPVNAEADYPTPVGDSVRLTGPRDVAELASESDAAHRGFVQRLFHHVVKQPASAYGPSALRDLTATFAASEFNIQKLIVEIATTTALHQAEQEP